MPHSNLTEPQAGVRVVGSAEKLGVRGARELLPLGKSVEPQSSFSSHSAGCAGLESAGKRRARLASGCHTPVHLLIQGSGSISFT